MPEHVALSEQETQLSNGKILLEEFYRPSTEIQSAIFDVYEKFIRWRSLREQGYKQFNGQQLTDWLEDGREKYWGYQPVSYDVDVPQFFLPETRNQINSLLARVAGMRMKPNFEGVEGFDIVKATILKDFFEYWRRSSNQKIKNFWAYLYMVINGTYVGFVGYKSRSRELRDITMFDPLTGETEWTKRKDVDQDVIQLPCNLEDIYIPKLWEPDIQEQDEIIWRTLIKWSDFKNAFAGYELGNYVFPGMQFADQSIFQQFISYDVRGSDFVEVIRYFNAPKDRYMIIANGVLLNPVKEKGTKAEIISPLPWNHKMLPFVKSVMEPLDPNFFYGMSLPQKGSDAQKYLNKFMELALEREIRSVSKPIITTDPSAQLGLEFKPGRVYQVGVDVNQYKEMQVEPVSGSFWNMIQMMQTQMNRSGSGSTNPVTGGKQPRSATEKAAEANQMKEANNFYFLFYEDLMEQTAWMAIQNMIQFYTAEKTNKILGEKKFRKILNMIDIQLADGGRGNRYIRITDNPAPNEELQNEAWYRSIFKKERAEIIEVSPKQLRQIKFDIKIEFEPEDSPVTERALFIDFAQTLVSLFQPYQLLDMKKMLFRMIETFGENVADYIPDQLVTDYENERFGIAPQQPTPIPGGTPEANKINQSTTGQMYGAMGPGNREANATGMPSPLQGGTNIRPKNIPPIVTQPEI